MRQQADHQFNERMTQAMMRGVRFADTPVQTYKRESGLPSDYFKKSWIERLFSWRQ